MRYQRFISSREIKVNSEYAHKLSFQRLFEKVFRMPYIENFRAKKSFVYKVIFRISILQEVNWFSRSFDL